MSALTQERRHVVKWTDVEQGYHFPCERRNLTEEHAAEIAEEFEHRRRIYYTGAMAPMVPFINVRVLVACDCGRDVEPGAEHTMPYTNGEACPGIRQVVAA